MGGFNNASPAEPTAKELEARRLERTRPKDARSRFPATDEGQEDYERWLATLPRGDRIMCNVICVPTGAKAAKGRKSYHAVRVVDRKIWAKLDGHARSRWIDRVRAELAN